MLTASEFATIMKEANTLVEKEKAGKGLTVAEHDRLWVLLGQLESHLKEREAVKARKYMPKVNIYSNVSMLN